MSGERKGPKGHSLGTVVLELNFGAWMDMMRKVGLLRGIAEAWN